MVSRMKHWKTSSTKNIEEQVAYGSDENSIESTVHQANDLFLNQILKFLFLFAFIFQFWDDFIFFFFFFFFFFYSSPDSSHTL